eukprot:2592595-Rhodomonas_salina.1
MECRAVHTQGRSDMGGERLQRQRRAYRSREDPHTVCTTHRLAPMSRHVTLLLCVSKAEALPSTFDLRRASGEEGGGSGRGGGRRREEEGGR